MTESIILSLQAEKVEEQKTLYHCTNGLRQTLHHCTCIVCLPVSLSYSADFCGLWMTPITGFPLTATHTITVTYWSKSSKMSPTLLSNDTNNKFPLTVTHTP